MRAVTLALLTLSGCTLQISGTVEGDVPPGATPTVLWQGWNVLGAVGGRGSMEGGAFQLDVNPPRTAEALGYGLMPEFHTGLVVLVDPEFDPAEPISPESVDHILAVDANQAVYRDVRPRNNCTLSGGCRPTNFPYGRGMSCISCEDGNCASSSCDAFVLTTRDDILNQPFLDAQGRFGDARIYDESGQHLAHATPDTEYASVLLWTTDIGAPRQLVYEFVDARQVHPTSYHRGQGLIVARVESHDGGFYSAVISTSGEVLWTIEHNVHSMVDGPYLSSDGTLVTWAEPIRVEIAQARTGEILRTHLFTQESYTTTVHWSAVEPTVYAFPELEAPDSVTSGSEGTATDWPQCEGARSATSNLCPEQGAPYVTHGMFGQLTPASPYDCPHRPYSEVPRGAGAPATALAPCDAL